MILHKQRPKPNWVRQSKPGVSTLASQHDFQQQIQVLLLSRFRIELRPPAMVERGLNLYVSHKLLSALRHELDGGHGTQRLQSNVLQSA